MPELPEVEIIAGQLKKEIAGLKVKDAGIFGHQLNKKDITNVSREAKVILIYFGSTEKVLSFHLGMTGRLLLRKKADSPDKYNRFTLSFSNGAELRFCDMRRFGYVRLIDLADIEKLKAKYGPTPFSKDFTSKEFHKILNRKMPIKSALLNQKLISGIGNIYANDALWMARINPRTTASQLSLKQAGDLLNSLRTILSEGFRHGGSTIKDFVDLYGRPGEQQKHFRVYGKKGGQCRRCKTDLQVVQIGGRGSFFCPTCQPFQDLPIKTCRLTS